MNIKQRRKNRQTYWIGCFVIVMAMMLIHLGEPLPPGADWKLVLLMLTIASSASFAVGWSIAWLNGFDAGFKEGSEDRG